MLFTPLVKMLASVESRLIDFLLYSLSFDVSPSFQGITELLRSSFISCLNYYHFMYWNVLLAEVTGLNREFAKHRTNWNLFTSLGRFRPSSTVITDFDANQDNANGA